MKLLSHIQSNYSLFKYNILCANMLNYLNNILINFFFFSKLLKITYTTYQTSKKTCSLICQNYLHLLHFSLFCIHFFSVILY